MSFSVVQLSCHTHCIKCQTPTAMTKLVPNFTTIKKISEFCDTYVDAVLYCLISTFIDFSSNATCSIDHFQLMYLVKCIQKHLIFETSLVSGCLFFYRMEFFT